MKLTISKEANINYLAKIVSIKKGDFSSHPNANKLKLVNVQGNIISTSIDAQPGTYIYFPTESVIAPEFLKFNNLYRNTNANSNPEQRGFFEESGRVKCIKLRGLASEGFIIPIQSLIDFYQNTYSKNVDSEVFQKLVGTQFDMVDNFKLVWKYIIKTNSSKSNADSKLKSKSIISEKLVDDQFRYHIDTPKLVDNLTEVNPDDIIQISWKEHGTSAIFCNLLTKRKLSWIERFLVVIGVNIKTEEYTKFCSSRKVIKDPIINPNLSEGYYDYNIWTLALETIKDYLDEGMSVYAEIVGYLPTGSMIQKDYDYGCVYDPKLYDYKTMSAKEMLEAKLFKIVVYRITSTNVSGKVFEWSTQQIKNWCNKRQIGTVTELYYGPAKKLFPRLTVKTHWHENFLKHLREQYLENDSVLCLNKVPEEGIVLRREVNNISVFKLKANAFLQKETASLDKGIVDIESAQEI